MLCGPLDAVGPEQAGWSFVAEIARSAGIPDEAIPWVFETFRDWAARSPRAKPAWLPSWRAWVRSSKRQVDLARWRHDLAQAAAIEAEPIAVGERSSRQASSGAAQRGPTGFMALAAKLATPERIERCRVSAQAYRDADLGDIA